MKPLRRELPIEVAEDRRGLHLAAELGLAGEVQRHGAEYPHERQPGGRAEHEPAGRVEHAERRHRNKAAAGKAADDRSDRLEEERDDERSTERDERRVRRVGVVEHLRRELRAEIGPDGQSGQRERACDEPAPEAV